MAVKRGNGTLRIRRERNAARRRAREALDRQCGVGSAGQRNDLASEVTAMEQYCRAGAIAIDRSGFRKLSAA